VIVILIARHFYVTKATLPMAENVERPAVQKVIYNKYFIDEFYYNFITRPLDALSAFLQNFFDNKIVNGLVNGFGQVVVKGGAFVRQLQSGNINAYAITFVIAVILIFSIFIF
jgi:NADH-quinone oxidoreductase subunit L